MKNMKKKKNSKTPVPQTPVVCPPLPPSVGLLASFEARQKATRLLSHLITWRAVSGKDMISFLRACEWQTHQLIDFEYGSDANITLGKLARYVNACELSLVITIGGPANVRMKEVVYTGDCSDKSRTRAVVLCSKSDIKKAIVAVKKQETLVSRLFNWRIDSGLTSECFSKKANIPIERVVELEFGTDNNVTIGDLLAYCRGAGVCFDLVVGNGTKIEKPFMLNDN